MTDKNVLRQVIGGLMQRPHLLSEVDKYSLTVSDFSSRFEKYIFSAITNLYCKGATNIQPIDVANYLESDVTASKTFEINHGVEYLQDAVEFSSWENFPYYYEKLKKLNLIRDLKKQGFDTSAFYCDDLTASGADEINAKFERLSVTDICNGVKRKLLQLESTYAQTGEIEESKASSGIRDFINQMHTTIEVGAPLQGAMYSKIFSGAQKKALTIRSGCSGLGKALPNSTIIPTPAGWRRVDEIQVGDYLFDAFGKPTKVLGVYPQGEKEVWQVVFKDGRTAKCCDEHLWSYVTSVNEYRNFTTKPLKEIAQSSLTNDSGEYQFLVPVAAAADYPTKSFFEIIEDTIPNRVEWLRTSIEKFGWVDENEDVRCIIKNKYTRHYTQSLAWSLGLKCFVLDENTIIIQGTAEEKKKLLKDPHERKKINNTEKDMETRYNAIIDIINLGYSEEMTCFYVDNDEHLFLTENFVVTHNTRQSVGDACYLAYPIRYNSRNRQWEQTGSCEKVLFIMTEQTMDQIRKMILAYLSDINESRFKLGNFSNEEQKVLEQAADVMEKYADNLILVKMPNPSVELVKTIVRENCLTKDIGYVFYDYIFIGSALLDQFRGFTLRHDEILLLFTTALKDLAVELDVAMFTSTQVNASADDNKNIRNEASLAGGRSTINKADNGAIMARPTPEELEILEPVTNTHGIPNCVTDIFKCRSGEWTQVRIWSQVDLGRLKKKDLFVTDARLEPIADFFSINEEEYEIHEWNSDAYQEALRFVEELNGSKEQIEERKKVSLGLSEYY